MREIPHDQNKRRDGHLKLKESVVGRKEILIYIYKRACPNKMA